MKRRSQLRSHISRILVGLLVLASVVGCAGQAQVDVVSPEDLPNPLAPNTTYSLAGPLKIDGIFDLRGSPGTGEQKYFLILLGCFV